MILAWLSAVFIAGVVVGTWEPVAPEPAWGLAALLCGGAYLSRRKRVHLPLLLLAALCLGASRSPHGTGSPSSGDSSFYNGRYAEIQGIVVAEPDVRDNGINYTVEAKTVTVKGKARSISGRVQVHTSRSQQLDYGHGVLLTGRLRQPRNHPGLPYREILFRQGIKSQMGFPRLVDLGPARSDWLGWIVPLRQHLEEGINAWLPEPEAALVTAIALGAHSASLGDLTPLLIATGLIHMIAISGIKVALVAGTLYQLARLTRRRTLGLVLPLSGLVLYVLLTGATASGERSALMWTVLFIATYLGRGTVSIVSLSFVAALMVAIDSTLPGDIGFQLSVIGTFAIVALTPSLIRLCRYLPSPLREAFCVTVAAQLGTLPVVIIGFHVVSIVGPVANALVLPLLPALIALGFLLGLVAGVGAVAAPAAASTYALAHLVVLVAKALASLPASMPAPALSAPSLFAYYVVLIAVSGFLLHRAHWTPSGHWASRGGEFSLAVIVATGGLVMPLLHAPQSPQAELSWVGAGEAALIRSHGLTALIDGGSRPFVLLEQLAKLLPYDTHTIDLLIVTDPRPKNVSGLEAVLRHYRVSEVLDVGTEYPSTTYARWHSSLTHRRISTYALRTGTEVQVGSVSILAVGPQTLYPNPSDCAGMLRISSRGRSVLFAGAASVREQFESVFRDVNLRSEVLAVEGKAVSIPFLRAVKPRLVVSRLTSIPGAKNLNLAKDSHFRIEF